MNTYLEQNLKAINDVDFALGARLLTVIPNTNFEVFNDGDAANINIIDTRTHMPLYISKPVDETLEKIDSMREFVHYPYLYFYGVGNGIFYKLMLENESIRRIVVVEPEPELLFIALHFVDFSEDIRSKRIIFTLSQYMNSSKAISYMGDRDANIYCRLYDLHLLAPYYNRYSADYLKINKLFVNAIEHAVVSIGNDSKDAIIGIEHHVKNLPEMIKSPFLTEFVKTASNTDTAIIVSTGPSLYKQLPILKEIAPYTTLFCIDASFPILHAHGIKPDIVFSLERVRESAKFYKDTPLEAQEGVIFAITSIVHEELLNAIKHGIKQISMRPFGYMRFFELVHYGYLGIGMSAANMAYEMVVHSRFKRCVFIGQDLAFGDDGTSHSKGAVYGEGEIKPNQSKGEKIFIEKYGGGGEVETTTVWRMFLNFFERDIVETPYKIDVINCTEGGARIHGTREMPFYELAKIIDKDRPKSPIRLSLPSDELIEEHTQQAKEKILDLLTYGAEKKRTVERLFLRVAAMTEELERLNNEQRLEDIDFKKLKRLLGDIEKIKNYFNEAKFLDIFLDAVQSYIIHQELEIAKIVVQVAEDDIHKKAKQIDWLYAHKYWLFSLAGGMDAVLEVVKRSASTWMEIPKDIGKKRKSSTTSKNLTVKSKS